MLVVDIDGTLIGSSRHVTPRVRAAVRAALDAGVLVTLATGRWFRSAQPIASDLGIELPIILHNGALVKDSLTGEILDHRHLPLDLAVAAIEVVCRHGLHPMVYENAFAGEWLLAGPVGSDTPSVARYLATKDWLRRVPPEALLAAGDPLEVVVADTAERAEPLVADLERGPWRTVTSMSLAVPEARFVEVLAPDCSKTNAIRRLGGRYGIGLDQVMVVGDNFNDLDMIEAAGLGVAMQNAPAAVRGRARWVAPHVEEDGLAVAIERFLLAPARPAPATGPSAPAAAGGSSG
ncbi:MAG TPA: Cof-type HAD-IIB family hydrolase [Chloroflexota bacterium]|jgi:hypothetical protein|nr:Cof-type HAD-IIB family hydrolase [Chloroflexota bacterium]